MTAAARAVPDKVVIVGASVAGVAVARALRAEGYDREIVLLGAEADWPYDKPPLSKEVLCGESDKVRTSLLTRDEARELAIDVHLGLAAEELDIAEREVVLADGERFGYGACVIATGATPRPSPWPLRLGVHELRTVRDSLAIRERFLAGGPVAVVGGGFIGSEVASSARTLGLAVTILDPLEAPMERLVGAAAARLFTDLAVRHGTELRLGHGVVAIEGTAGELTVRLTDGSTVEAATAVIGIGADPVRLDRPVRLEVPDRRPSRERFLPRGGRGSHGRTAAGGARLRGCRRAPRRRLDRELAAGARRPPARDRGRGQRRGSRAGAGRASDGWASQNLRKGGAGCRLQR